MQNQFQKSRFLIVIISLLCFNTLTTVYAQPRDVSDKISSEVFETLSRDGEATVLIMLNTDSFRNTPHVNANDRRSQVATQRSQVLNKLPVNAYRAGHHFQTVPALVGTVFSENTLNRLANDPNVQRIDLNGGGGSVHLDQSIPLVGAGISHGNGVTGKDVVIAVLDGGFDSDHPSLQNKLIHEACFLDFDGAIDGNGHCSNGSDRQFGLGSAEDDQGHGTFVSGVIASDGVSPAGVGMAPDADIVSLKVIDSNASFYSTSEIVAALDYIYLNLPEVKIINMSLGTF